jgi:transposase
MNELTMSMIEKQNKSRSRRSFTEEFRADAVTMLLDEVRRIVDLADAIGVGEGALGNSVRLENLKRGERAGFTWNDRAELADFGEENDCLRLERDTLKPVTAVSVKELGQ